MPNGEQLDEQEVQLHKQRVSVVTPRPGLPLVSMQIVEQAEEGDVSGEKPLVTAIEASNFRKDLKNPEYTDADIIVTDDDSGIEMLYPARLRDPKIRETQQVTFELMAPDASQHSHRTKAVLGVITGTVLVGSLIAGRHRKTPKKK